MYSPVLRPSVTAYELRVFMNRTNRMLGHAIGEAVLWCHTQVDIGQMQCQRRLRCERLVAYEAHELIAVRCSAARRCRRRRGLLIVLYGRV